KRAASRALLACPTGAIGSSDKSQLAQAMKDFPLHIDEEVYFLGYTSEKSFGGSSYLIVRPDGNWMIDSPRYIPRLAKKIEEMGGIRYILLTHRDDVADAAKYARHFKAESMIHELEKSAQPDAEHIIKGF